MGLRGEAWLALMVGLCMSVGSAAQLRVGYYSSRGCPQAESIVRSEVRKAVMSDVGLAAGLLRMHFHDCFVRGCDGSVLIDSTSNNTAEKDAPPNNPSLRGFQVIDSAKLQLESACKGVVSCADILAFAARDSVSLSGGLSYQVPAGRKDGRVSLASEALANLPPPTSNLNQLTQIFATKGLTQIDMITLSGAHTIGRSHCTSFSNRLQNFNSTVSVDPSLDPKYASQLKRLCSNVSNVVPLDPRSPNLFDNNYYHNVRVNRGLFTSDQALISTVAAAAQVRRNAFNPVLFQRDFVTAMGKMGRIGVLTGGNGEIRRKCRVIN